jgi:hypothetical protein
MLNQGFSGNLSVGMDLGTAKPFLHYRSYRMPFAYAFSLYLDSPHHPITLLLAEDWWSLVDSDLFIRVDPHHQIVPHGLGLPAHTETSNH